MADRRLVVSCEHGGNRVPPAYVPLFAGALGQLNDHRGWDKGAAHLAEQIADAFGVDAHVQTVSRLVVDNNRSPGHPKLFSALTRPLGEADRERLLARHYRPHRARVEAAVAAALRHGPVLHVAVHSFTSVLDGVVRDCDVGLLYDPGRRAERAVAQAWKGALERALPGFRIRSNYPYKGTSDGLTTAFRKRFGARYAGIELELNQKHYATAAWHALEGGIVATLLEILST